MSSWLIFSIVLNSCAVLLLVWAALHDLAARTVPNGLPAAIFAIGVCARLADHAVLQSLGVAFFGFLMLFFLWRRGAIGGGDVKLWSASVLLIPANWQLEFSCFTRILLAGGVLALLYLALRIVVKRPAAAPAGGKLARIIRAEAWRISRRAPLPYACAIACGTILTLLPRSFPALS